jgi:hypothetical protein
MEINWPGEKLLVKLCDTVGSKGIGSLLKPWQMRREGAAAAEIKRLNSLMLAQTKIEVADIHAGRKVLLANGKLAAADEIAVVEQGESATRFEIFAELEKVVEASVQKEAFRKEISVAKAILYAEQELEQETQPAKDEPVSDDWLLRWRDNAASVSSDELQALWGKVLAGEVKSPGSYSLRALDFLKNISRDDAVLIERLAPYVIGNIIFRSESDQGLESLSFAEVLELQEIGILSGVEAVGMQNTYSSVVSDRFIQPLTCHGRLILVVHEDVNRKLSMPIYGVTKIGREILSLGWKKADESYLRSVAERIKAQGFNVQIGDFTIAGENLISYSNMVEI